MQLLKNGTSTRNATIKTKIEWICFLNSSGYSSAAQNYIRALDYNDYYDIRVKTFGGRPSKPSVSDAQYEYFMKMVKKEEDPESISVYHCIPNIQRRVKPHKKNIGFATFETFNPDIKWIDILNKNDAILVPSQFNYRIFSHMPIQKPIFYIPHCINIDEYHKDVEPLVKYDKFTFLFMGIWRERKGYKQLLEAWFNEFSEKDNVQLLIKTDFHRQAEKYVMDYRNSRRIKQGFAPIIIENKMFDETILPRFIKSAHCLISPTYGEGFCMPGLQCMALHIPIIITDFSGCQDYANENTARLLKPKGFVQKHEMDGIPQFRNKKWAFIEVKDIQKEMRYVVNHYKDLSPMINEAYHVARSNFNYQIVNDLFGQMVREIYG